MKIYIDKIFVSSITLLFSLVGCCPYSNIFEEDGYPLAVSISDSGFTSASDTKATTRATESGYATTFVTGDQIGLYVVNSSNTVEIANLCLTYDGTNWNYPTSTMLYYDITANKKYFAYYPYQSTLTGAPTLSSTSAATDAATFFATAIASWTPATDQSTQAKYTASDLMVGTGVAGTLYSNATRAMSFGMVHQMALVDMNFPYYYLSTDNSYTYTLGLTCKGFTPYHLSNGNYRYIIKPATSTSIWGYYCTTTSSNTNQIFNKAITAATGTYQTINVDGGAVGTSHTLTIGDYYLNNGSVIPNATTNKYLLDKAIGVVFNTSTSTTDQGHGWKHGYAMALKNAATSAAWSINTTTDESSLLTSKGYIYVDHSDYPDFINNKDGYTETYAVNHYYSSLLQNEYPAFYDAVNYGVTVPSGSSNWYLPSIGQWWDIVVNLGGMMSTELHNYGSAYCYWKDSSGSVNYSSTCAANINSYLSNLNKYGSTVDTFSGEETVYWSSSEYQSNLSYLTYFVKAGDMSLYGQNGIFSVKTNTYIIRPVVAF